MKRLSDYAESRNRPLSPGKLLPDPSFELKLLAGAVDHKPARWGVSPLGNEFCDLMGFSPGPTAVLFLVCALLGPLGPSSPVRASASCSHNFDAHD